jgi:hypothetical protein
VEVLPGEEDEEDIADLVMFARGSGLEREDTDLIGLGECGGCDDEESLPER